MQRDHSSLADRSNGRLGTFEVKNTGRKPLFKDAAPRTNDKNKENGRAQPSSLFGASVLSNGLSRSASVDMGRPSFGLVSHGGTRIPQPGFSSSIRKPLTITESMMVAEREGDKGSDDDDNQSSVMDASPSPAPKVWLERHEGDEKRMRRLLGQDHLDTKAPNRPLSRQSSASSTVSDVKPSPEKNKSPRRRTLYGKPRTGLVHNDSTHEPLSTLTNGVKREDHGEKAVGGLRPPESNLLRHMPSKDDLTNQGRIPALVPGIEDLLPSIENSALVAAGTESPRKNFAWQIDDDLTMGDAQISNSPRIKTGLFADRRNFDDGSEIDINSRTRVAPPGSRNTKLDEIRSREVKTGSDIPVDLPRPRPHNTKLDEIRDREEKVEHQIPLPDRNAPRPRNTKLEEIRQREIVGPNKRSLAHARLSEIREQNAMARSLSPEESRFQTSRDAILEDKPSPELENKLRARSKSESEAIGQTTDTPVTTLKIRPTTTTAAATASAPAERSESKGIGEVPDSARPALSHKRTDSRDLLRRLARATSSSPGPESAQQRPASSLSTDKSRDLPADSKSSIPRSSSDNGPRYTRRNQQKMDKAQDFSRPTVGFVDPPRSRSTDSTKSKKSNAQSEVDPTDRIEAEMDLFALLENQSEKGSVRAPSPLPESEDEKDPEATPRSIKQDPLTMPTPKVTGAYIETPATVKVEKIDMKKEDRQIKREERQPRSRSTSLRNKRTEHVANGSDQDSASDPGTDDKTGATASSSGVRRRRARAPSRRRSTPLENSAALPTAKGDLKDLQRMHNIDDSTLDDLEEVLHGRKTPSRDLEILLHNLPQHPIIEDDSDLDRELNTKLNTKSNTIDPDSSSDALARMTRMNDRLKNSLYGIHTAARGIERLSEEVNHNNRNNPVETKAVKAEAADTKDLERKPAEAKVAMSTPPKMETQKVDHVPHVLSDDFAADEVSYIPNPVHWLYRRKPHFRLTLLGLLTLLLSIWYAAESAMCAGFCRPVSCGSGPCIWSIDDPTFGIAIPVKLDQWVTGGRGRVLANQFMQEADDWIAEVIDACYGRQITEIDINSLSFEGKRQHRRRLRKKGLVKPRVEDPQQKAKWDEWRRARLAKERQKEAREMGYDVRDEWEESVGGDTRVW